MILWPALALALAPGPPSGPPPPVFQGDPDAPLRLEAALEAAWRGTEAFGPWPVRPWTVRVHLDDAAFDRATGGFPGRDAAWVGDTLHLRPLERLRRRDLDRLLRHELVHRRLDGQGLRPWAEEARCLWAETHLRPPEAWPPAPEAALQHRLDRALRAGTPRLQAWAYGALRAWLDRKPLPPAPLPPPPARDPWRPVADSKLRRPLAASDFRRPLVPQIPAVTVVWPPERLPRVLRVQGRDQVWRPGAAWTFHGEVTFGEGAPVARLEGRVELRAVAEGWRLAWTAPETDWVAAAVEGELGAEAPIEAKRALAAVLIRWSMGPGRHRHVRGERCPLTHCAVVRGSAGPETLEAVRRAPALRLDPEGAFFCGSKGGVALSPRQVWGRGAASAPPAEAIPGDRWAAWERTLSPDQVAHLKRAVRPGLRPGQRGLRLGPSGPYPVEALRLAAGRAFGWTTWPSNACTAEPQPDGSLRLTGHGWGHNTGLCLATALHRARQGQPAEAILAEAFGEASMSYRDEGVTGAPVRVGGGTLRKSGRLGGQDPGPMEIAASGVQAGDGKTYRAVRPIQHVQMESGRELHVTVRYEVTP